MTLSVVLFALIAAAMAVSALGVVLSRSVVRAAVWLLFALIGVSLLFFLLGAEFLGAAQLILYVGGTLVLVVFGVMLTSQGPFAGPRSRPAEWLVGVLLTGSLFALLVKSTFGLVPASASGEARLLPGSGPLGLAFLGIPEGAGTTSGPAYLLPFEIVSVHLLVVLIAAAYLARAKRKKAPSARILSETGGPS